MIPLTQVIRKPVGKRTPLLVEVPISVGLDGPFLVSSAQSFLWISEPFPSGSVRVAVRNAPLDFLYREAVQAVSELSAEMSWGSCLRWSPDALEKAQEYLQSYGIGDTEVLSNREINPEGSTACPWLPSGWAAVLPREREFLGTSIDFGDEMHALVLHNCSRALALVLP